MGNNLNTISKKDVEFLSEHTEFQGEEIKDFYTKFMKAHPDGLMEYESFKDFLYSVFHQSSDNFARHYFRAVDKDNSGKINFKEFLLFLNSERTCDLRERLDWLFNLFDINGNGTIERKEMVEIYKTACSMTKDAGSTAEETTDELFRYCDTDKNNALTKEEFMDTFLKNPQLEAKIPMFYCSTTGRSSKDTTES